MTGKKLLIIDDESASSAGPEARLKASGYEVFAVLEHMRGLVDLMAAPVIVLSARDPAHNEKRALDAGAVPHFQKTPTIGNS